MSVGGLSTRPVPAPLEGLPAGDALVEGDALVDGLAALVGLDSASPVVGEASVPLELVVGATADVVGVVSLLSSPPPQAAISGITRAMSMRNPAYFSHWGACLKTLLHH
jgi:hypothetical protein